MSQKLGLKSLSALFRRVLEWGNTPDIDHLATIVKDVPDFPKEGILFRDVSPLIRDHWSETVTTMLDLFSPEQLAEVDAFVGLDARGFIFAGGMADRLNKGLVMARKAGKLPDALLSEDYDLEYGKAQVEIQAGEGMKVIIVDDVLATGGTLTATADLCKKAGYEVLGIATLINLTQLNDFEWGGQKCLSVFEYDENGYIPVAEREPKPKDNNAIRPTF